MVSLDERENGGQKNANPMRDLYKSKNKPKILSILYLRDEQPEVGCREGNDITSPLTYNSKGC